MTVLVLNHEEVEQLLAMNDCIDVMAEALHALAREQSFVPLRPVIRPPAAPGFMGLMPGWSQAEGWGLKVVNIYPENPGRGLDAHQGAVLLHDGVTGELRALLNASAVTEIRTAAVSAVATRALAREGAQVVAILGGGVQARSHEAAMRAILPAAEIRTWRRADGGTAEETVRGADVVCCCTSAREPILERVWLDAGAHVNAVGSSVPTARELDAATVAAATLVVDRRESAVNEAGDLLLAGFGEERIAAELGEVLVGEHPGRTDAAELTVFKSLGLGVEDLAAGELVVRKARERGVGTEVSF